MTEDPKGEIEKHDVELSEGSKENSEEETEEQMSEQ